MRRWLSGLPWCVGLRFIDSPKANTIRPFPALTISLAVYKAAAPLLPAWSFYGQSFHLTDTRHRATLDLLEAEGDSIRGEVVWCRKTQNFGRRWWDALAGGAAFECTKGQ